MSSPTRGPVRRRQRSARAAVACLLLLIGVLAVVGAVLSGSWPLLAVAAGLAVALGAAATRITYLEVLQSRRDAATDRAELAQEYSALTAETSERNVLFAADMTGKISRREASIDRLEKRLAEATAELIEAQRALEESIDVTERIEEENDRLVIRLEDAEQRAAVAIIRLAELEQERDVLIAEWQAADVSKRFQAG
jgi:chromosome segregation ATPase